MQSERDSHSARFAGAIRKLDADDPSGPEDLLTIFGPGIRFLLARKGVSHVDHIIESILARVADQVRLERPVDPKTLASYVSAAMNESRCVDHLVAMDAQQPIVTQNAAEVLTGLDEREREALLRFYGREQPSVQVCRDLGFTEVAFAELRARVKAKVGRDTNIQKVGSG